VHLAVLDLHVIYNVFLFLLFPKVPLSQNLHEDILDLVIVQCGPDTSDYIRVGFYLFMFSLKIS